MNVDDLQNEWNQQFDGTESSGELVVKLFKESRQSKIVEGLKKLVFQSVLFMAFNLFVVICGWIVLVEEFSNLGVAIPAAVMILLSAIVFYKNVMQLDLIRKIDFSLPIVQLQTTIERLKLKRVRHNRFIFIFSCLYFWLAVALFFRWDVSLLIPAVWEKAPVVVIIHVGMLLIWFPMSFWLLRIYDNVDGRNTFWQWLERDSYLTDHSVNLTLNESMNYLKELQAFDSGKIS